MKFEWENLYLNEVIPVITSGSRAKVFGGWLVQTNTLVKQNLSVTTTFVPDQNHEWTIA